MKTKILLLGFIFIVSGLFGQNENIPSVQNEENVEITPEEIYNHIAFLASDRLKGRFPGTPEIEEAAQYIRNDLKKDGLKLLGDSGFQYFKITISAKAGKNNFLKIGNKKYKIHKDFVPLAFTKNAKISGNAVIVGYGIEKKQDSLQWNDYGNISVKGKWVIIFRGKPLDSGLPSDFFKGASDERTKIYTASKKGAIGVIFISTSQNKNDLIPFRMPRFYAESPIPAISVSTKVAEDIFTYVKISLKSYKEKINKRSLPWEEINIKIDAGTDVHPVKVRTENVIAVLEGADPKLKNRYIVIGAHYDHLGMGGYDSGSRMPDTIAVHNGADDNASGVAGVLELAEYLSAHRKELGRSIIFMSFSAEERGLLGSQYFVDNPLVPLDSIDLMINMDMIGKYGRQLSIMGTGSGDAIDELLKKVKYDTTRLHVKPVEKAYGGSDHYSFYTAGVPALFFYASTAEDYHTPFDDADKIRPNEEALILKYIAEFTKIVSVYPRRIKYIKQKTDTEGRSYGTSVKLGIVPAFEDTGNKGLKISDVVSGQPAEKAGLKGGDIITRINDTKIGNIYDYMEVMKTFKPKQKIKVEVLRNGKKLKFDIQL